MITLLLFSIECFLQKIKNSIECGTLEYLRSLYQKKKI
jgi:hypothetical protein